MTYFSEIAALLFGLCVGSFANVCIYRIPGPGSIVSPRRSFCPQCRTPISFYDNIPVISYIFLMGKCRSCKNPIPIRYPIVELTSGLFALCAVLKFGVTPEALIYFAFIEVLIIITYIDIDLQIIPDVLSLPGIPVFFILSLFVPQVTLKESLIGLLIGGGSLYAVSWGYYLLKKEEGMGGGDIKLLAMIGVLIGWKGVLFTIFVSSAVGTISGIIVMLSQKEGMKLAIPFGPFLSIGAITYIFLGADIIQWYLGFLY